MICNETRSHIFAVFFLLIVLIQASSCEQKQIQQKQKDYEEDNNGLLGTKGDLYEVFKKRLEKFNSEMSLNKEDLFDEKPNKNMADEKRSTVRECLYEEYKKRLDKINNELSLDGEKVFDRSGRNTEKESSTISGTNIAKNKIEDAKGVVEDNVANAKQGNSVIKKNADTDNAEMTLFKEINDKTKHQATDRQTCLKNYDLKKLQSSADASEDEKTIDKATDGKVQSYNSGNTVNNLNSAQLIIPNMHSNKATIALPTNNRVNFKNEPANNCQRQAESVVDKREADFSTRDVPAELIPTDLSPSYPNVLTKGLGSEMISSTHVASSNLLNSVASKLKTSPLDLAKKLATATDGSTNIKNDPKLTKLLQKYIESSVNLNSNGRTTKDTAANAALTESLCMPQDLPHYQVTSMPQNNQIPQAQPQPQPQPQAPCPMPQPQPQCPIPGPVQTLEYNSVSNILEKVLTKLEQIQEAKPDNLGDKFCEVEGAPCEILGTWNSYIMGLRFGIKTSSGGSGNGKKRLDKYSESENLVLSIDVQETNPPKLHQIMDTGWKFTGSAMKQIGGPFFIISETKAQNVLATFAGYCRTCGSIDTIFGSWTFVFPSKDCQDISVAIENKRDLFRRDLLDAKIGERYNTVACEKGKKPKCMPKKK